MDPVQPNHVPNVIMNATDAADQMLDQLEDVQPRHLTFSGLKQEKIQEQKASPFKA